MSVDLGLLRQWIGREESSTDIASATPVRALAATLDRDDAAPAPGDEIAPGCHWLYFLPLHRQSEIGPDGHAKRGGFLPPVPLARRMWAGSRIEFARPLRVGQPITRVSRIVDVDSKEGRAGPLVFVKLRHEISTAGAIAITEEQDLVYRDKPRPGETAPPAKPAPVDHDWQREIRADDVLMFRYSALTFNGFRIHYDRPYATQVEGYPGLVVHGPLIATLLLDLLRRHMPDARVSRFHFRAVTPLFDIHPFVVCGRVKECNTVDLWAKTPDGSLAMEANATVARGALLQVE